MKFLGTWALVLFFAVVGTGVKAQTSLSGRVYQNPNIMAGMFSKGSIDEAKKKVAEGSKDPNDQMIAMAPGTSIGITVEFKSATQAEMKYKIRMSDDAMKIAGMGWAKRQAMKAAMATMPMSETGPYVVKNNLVLFGNAKEGYDTLSISPDGKQLCGNYAGGKDKKPMKFVLKRTK